jgi:hypothetical protein
VPVDVGHIDLKTVAGRLHTTLHKGMTQLNNRDAHSLAFVTTKVKPCGERRTD